MTLAMAQRLVVIILPQGGCSLPRRAGGLTQAGNFLTTVLITQPAFKRGDKHASSRTATCRFCVSDHPTFPVSFVGVSAFAELDRARGGAGLVLAGGMDLVAERIAGPFEMPWSVGVLPDGSFLVTERPGRLQHVTRTAGTYAVDGVPPVLYFENGGLLDVAVNAKFEENSLIYLSYLQGEETASIIKVMRAGLDADQGLSPNSRSSTKEARELDLSFSAGGSRSPATDISSLSLGDRWDAAKAQDLSGTAGPSCA